MENSSKLNSVEHYSQLMSLSKRIGYEISKVVFRGYHTSDQLQRLHDQVHKQCSVLTSPPPAPSTIDSHYKLIPFHTHVLVCREAVGTEGADGV